MIGLNYKGIHPPSETTALRNPYVPKIDMLLIGIILHQLGIGAFPDNIAHLQLFIFTPFSYLVDILC